jgi:hypothetical protein
MFARASAKILIAFIMQRGPTGRAAAKRKHADLLEVQIRRYESGYRGCGHEVLSNILCFLRCMAVLRLNIYKIGFVLQNRF